MSICDFLGIKETPLDWTILMSAVEKIESLGFGTSFKTNYVRINPKDGYYDEYIVRVELNSDGWFMCQNLEHGHNPYSIEFNRSGKEKIDKFEAIHKAVTEFIKYYQCKLRS